MANTTNITKAELQDNLKETKAELKETKDALKDAMSLIEDMKKKLEEQPQVTVVQQPTERRTNSKIRCISLSYDPLNISTLPNGQGRVFTFKNYGQSMYIKYDDMLDILSAYPNTIESGLLYITDKDFCEEQGVYDDMDKIYTKDTLDKVVYLRRDVDVELLQGMSKPLLESTIRKIAELYNANEAMEANKLAAIKETLGYDIVKIAEDIKVEPTEREE